MKIDLDKITGHSVSRTDGEEINNFLIDSYQAGHDNFIRKVDEYERNCPASYLTEFFDDIVNGRSWVNNPTEFETYLLTFVIDIKHDYIKSLQHLLQGYVSDHYFFVRRAIENAQYMLFLKEKIKSVDDFKIYLELSTKKFKGKYKFKDWFSSKKEYFEKTYKQKVEAYEDACNLGVHANQERKELVQSIVQTSDNEAIILSSMFHDISSPLYSYDMGPAFWSKLNRTFFDLVLFLYKEKIFSVSLDQGKVSRFASRMDLCNNAILDHYKKMDPDLKHFKLL